MYDKGRKMVCECIECGHRQVGWSGRDGDTCEKCKGYPNPLGWWDDIYKRDDVIDKAGRLIDNGLNMMSAWMDEFKGNTEEVTRRIEEGRKAMESKEMPLLSKKSVDKSTL